MEYNDDGKGRDGSNGSDSNNGSNSGEGSDCINGSTSDEGIEHNAVTKRTHKIDKGCFFRITISVDC